MEHNQSHVRLVFTGFTYIPTVLRPGLSPLLVIPAKQLTSLFYSQLSWAVETGENYCFLSEGHARVQLRLDGDGEIADSQTHEGFASLQSARLIKCMNRMALPYFVKIYSRLIQNI